MKKIAVAALALAFLAAFQARAGAAWVAMQHAQVDDISRNNTAAYEYTETQGTNPPASSTGPWVLVPADVQKVVLQLTLTPPATGRIDTTVDSVYNVKNSSNNTVANSWSVGNTTSSQRVDLGPVTAWRLVTVSSTTAGTPNAKVSARAQ